MCKPNATTCWRNTCRQKVISDSWSPGLRAPPEGFWFTPRNKYSPNPEGFEAHAWLPPQIFNGIRFRRPPRPLQDLNVCLLEPLLWLSQCYILGHRRAGRHVHHPSSVFCLRPGDLVQDFTVRGCVHRPLAAVKSFCTLSRETAPKRNASTSVFDGGDGVPGVAFNASLLPNAVRPTDAKELNFQQFEFKSTFLKGKD